MPNLKTIATGIAITLASIAVANVLRKNGVPGFTG